MERQLQMFFSDITIIIQNLLQVSSSSISHQSLIIVWKFLNM